MKDFVYKSTSSLLPARLLNANSLKQGKGKGRATGNHLSTIADVKSLRVELLKKGAAGANSSLQRAFLRRASAIKSALKEVQPFKGQPWADQKIKSLESDLQKSIVEVVATPDSKFVNPELRKDVIKWQKASAKNASKVKKARTEFQKYDHLFGSKNVLKILSKKGFTGADLKAVVAQESGDFTLDDTGGKIVGIAQIGEGEAKEVGGKLSDRDKPETAIPLAAKVLIRKAELLEAALKAKGLSIPTGVEYRKFVFASYNGGSATIATAAQKAKTMKLDPRKWDQLVKGKTKSALYFAAMKHLKDTSKYNEISRYVERILSRL